MPPAGTVESVICGRLSSYNTTVPPPGEHGADANEVLLVLIHETKLRLRTTRRDATKGVAAHVAHMKLAARQHAEIRILEIRVARVRRLTAQEHPAESNRSAERHTRDQFSLIHRYLQTSQRPDRGASSSCPVHGLFMACAAHTLCFYIAGAMRFHSVALSYIRAARSSVVSPNAGQKSCTPTGSDTPSSSANPPGIEMPPMPARFAVTV